MSTDGTRWEGLTAEEAIQQLEQRIAATRARNNRMYVLILAASQSAPTDAKALLQKAVVEFAPRPSRRPKRNRRRVRRLFEQGAALSERP